MDFWSQSDGEYKWILQIKDTFSRYVWLYAMKDKSALTVVGILLVWLSQNGYMRIL
jgi:transposase InsO family protein